MKTYVRCNDPQRVRHAVGEIVWATVGNFLEKRDCNRKPRPVVILQPQRCQHSIVGLTTQARCRGNGELRSVMPTRGICGLCGTSFLWSPRPSRVCRLDVRSHIGWVNHDLVDVIERDVWCPSHVIDALRRVADEHGCGRSLGACSAS